MNNEENISLVEMNSIGTSYVNYGGFNQRRAQNSYENDGREQNSYVNDGRAQNSYENDGREQNSYVNDERTQNSYVNLSSESEEDEESYEDIDIPISLENRNQDDTSSIDFMNDPITPIYRPTTVLRHEESQLRNKCKYFTSCAYFMMNHIRSNKLIYIVAAVVLICITTILIGKSIGSSDSDHDHDHETTTNDYGTTTYNYTTNSWTSKHTTLFSTSDYTTDSTISDSTTDYTITPETKPTDDPRCVEIPACCDDGVWICNNKM